jgi:L-asparaginase II
MSTGVPLVEVTRGNVVERVHYGHVVVVNQKKKVAFSLGNPFKKTYMRSCAKPVQVLPFVRSGGMEHFGFTDKELAIFCASHYAEPFHMETLENILEKINLSEKNLLCGVTTSLKLEYAFELARRDVPLNQLYNDCSGKHLGMLALCQHRNYPIDHYISPDHPAQEEIISTFADFCEIPAEDIQIGIDGCSAPVFALPIYHMALAYLKLSNPDSLENMQKYGSACKRIFRAMTMYPEMIAGTNGFCTELMTHTNGKLIGKVGAEGVYCVGVKDKGLALAVKIDDGSMAVLPSVVIQLLSDFDLLTEEEKEKLTGLWFKDVLNDRKMIVGVQKPCFGG